MSLLAPLTLLATHTAGAAERNRAAESLRRSVETWIGGFLRRKDLKLGQEDQEDILQHLLLRASTGSARLRGTTEGEAMRWCQRVIYNKAIDILTEDGPAGRPTPLTPPPVDEQPGEPEIDPRQLEDLVRRIEESIARTSRRGDAETLVLQFRCCVEHLLGSATDQQIARYGFAREHVAEARDETATRRARDRVFQYRRRGRQAGCKALRSLLAGGVDAEEVAFAARFLACKDAPDAGSAPSPGGQPS